MSFITHCYELVICGDLLRKENGYFAERKGYVMRRLLKWRKCGVPSISSVCGFCLFHPFP